MVYGEMDLDHDGTVSIDELIRAVIGEMNDFRKGIVMEAFRKMDKDGSGDLRVNMNLISLSLMTSREFIMPKITRT